MTYTTQNHHGFARLACTIEGALSQAVTMIYISEKARADARAELAQGKPVTIADGTKTVTITPGAQP
jgi:hypothetical protein